MRDEKACGVRDPVTSHCPVADGARIGNARVVGKSRSSAVTRVILLFDTGPRRVGSPRSRW
ncbi:hypothetical protein GCM10022205_19640 [Spinactinospora alkalitolerans]